MRADNSLQEARKCKLVFIRFLSGYIITRIHKHPINLIWRLYHKTLEIKDSYSIAQTYYIRTVLFTKEKLGFIAGTVN
jgi:hypothetical protein